MSDLAIRALSLHERGTITLGPCPSCKGARFLVLDEGENIPRPATDEDRDADGPTPCPLVFECHVCQLGSAGARGLDLTPQGALLACARQKVRLFPGYSQADGQFYAVQYELGHTNSGWKGSPADAALSALESAIRGGAV